MVKRSLASALRPLSGFHAVLAESSMAHGARQFSSSPTHGLKAVFTETENVQLNEVLKNIQDKIILPAFLPPKQRKIILDPKMRTHLQQNPIVIELDGLEHKFSSINRFSEIPDSKQALHQALDLMKTKEDWDNLATLLAGYKKAGIRLKKSHIAKVIRRAGYEGQANSIVECAKQAQATGLRLEAREFVAQLLVRINDKVVGSSDPKSIAAAANLSEIVLDLLQREPHANEGVKPVNRLHISPPIRGIVLYTQASAALAKQAAGEPFEAELAAVVESVELLEAGWERLGLKDPVKHAAFSELNPHTHRNIHKKYDSALGATDYISVIAQNIKGMELARGLLGKDGEDLEPLEKELEQHLKAFVTKGKISKRWVEEYEKITGRAPKWPNAEA